MTNVERNYEALQSSWFAGEPLTPAEEQRRLELASQDPLFAAEGKLLAELRQRLEVGEPNELDADLVQRVLTHPDLSPQLPHLRLVRHEQRAELPFLPARFSKAREHTRFGEEPVNTRGGKALVNTRLAESIVHTRLGNAGAWSLVAAAVIALALSGAWLWQRNAAPQPLVLAPAKKLVAAMLSAPARAELVFVSGQLGPESLALPLGGRPLEAGAVIETAAGQACLTIDPGVDVCLGAWSRAELRSLRESQLELQVKRGLVMATLTHRAPGQTFSLSSNGLKATAIGTTFGIDARGAASEVVVLEGTVEVKPGAGAASEFVRGHSRWRAASGAQSSPSAIGRAEEAPLWALLAPRELWRHSEVGILELRSGATGLTAALDESHRFPLPLSTFLPAGKHQLKVRNNAGAEASYSIEVDAGEHRTLEIGDPSVEHRTLEIGDFSKGKATAAAGPASAIQAKALALSPAILLERARGELRAGNVSKALNGYAELRRAFPGSPEAWTVLPIMGRLELEQQKAPARALGLFDTYLSRSGPLRQEALSGRIRALKALGQSGAERSAIELFLNQYPKSLEASALRQRLHTLSAP